MGGGEKRHKDGGGRSSRGKQGGTWGRQDVR